MTTLSSFFSFEPLHCVFFPFRQSRYVRIIFFSYLLLSFRSGRPAHPDPPQPFFFSYPAFLLLPRPFFAGAGNLLIGTFSNSSNFCLSLDEVLRFCTILGWYLPCPLVSPVLLPLSCALVVFFSPVVSPGSS